MKRFIYMSMVVAFLMVTGCTNFDDYSGEKYGDGPAVDLQLSNVSDSAFLVTVAPKGEAGYYSYLVEAADAASEYTAIEILKCVNKDKGTAGTVSYAVDKTYSFTFKALPNVIYQVYAVAASPEGMVGKVTVSTVVTTDGEKPIPVAMKGDDKGVAVSFSESMQRGSGKVFARVYASAIEEFVGEIVEVPAEGIVIAKDVVTLSLPKTHAGANVYFYWEENAFADLTGNACPAYTEKEDLTKWKGTYRVPTKEWKLAAEDTTFYFQTWNEVVMEVKGAVWPMISSKNFDVKVTYNSEGKTSTITVPNGFYSDEADTLFLVALPEEPLYGTAIDLTIGAGSLVDIYGNPNTAFTIENYYFRSYGYTVDQFVGEYNLAEFSYFDEAWEQESGILFEKDAKVENGLIIKNLFKEGTSIKAKLNGYTGKINIPDWQKLAEVKMKDGSTDVVYFSNGESSADVVFTIKTDGTMESQTLWGYNLEEAGAWLDAFSSSKFAMAAPSQNMKNMKAAAQKPMVLHKGAKKMR